MHKAIGRQIKHTKASIMAGHPASALQQLDHLLSLLQRHPPDADELHTIETAMTELRELAQAATTGARAAVDQIQLILQQARSLETYDHHGQRKVADTATAQPRRF